MQQVSAGEFKPKTKKVEFIMKCDIRRIRESTFVIKCCRTSSNALSINNHRNRPFPSSLVPVTKRV